MTASDYTNAALMSAVLLLWGCDWVLSGISDGIRDASITGLNPPQGENAPSPAKEGATAGASNVSENASSTVLLLEKYARITSANQVLRFLSIQVWIVGSLALALSYFKPFTEFAGLLLPDKVFGLVVLASYCGLFATWGVIAADVREAIKRLFGRSN